MIESNIYKTYFSKILLYIISSFVLLFINYDSIIYDIIQVIFVMLLIGDMVLEIYIVIRNFGVLKLLIVIMNILIKFILISIYLSVVLSVDAIYDILLAMYVGIIIIGLICYPLLVIFFLIDTYKDEIIEVDKPLLLLLLSGSVMFVAQFFLPTKFIGPVGDTEQIVFYFNYALIIIYIPVIFVTFVYTSTLFSKD